MRQICKSQVMKCLHLQGQVWGGSEFGFKLGSHPLRIYSALIFLATVQSMDVGRVNETRGKAG